MKLGKSLVWGTFLRRPNRFLAVLRVRGTSVGSFVPNPGRLAELLVPGTKVLLNEAASRSRKTRYDAVAVQTPSGLVSIDSRIPNALVIEGLREGKLEGFEGYKTLLKEYTWGTSRFDLLLKRDAESCLLEVKSCTLVRNGRALFPDAPTERGRRHLLELMRAKRHGYRSAVIFVIQRVDARIFSPNDETDPKFGRTLRAAASRGVEVFAYSCAVGHDMTRLHKRVPVELEASISP